MKNYQSYAVLTFCVYAAWHTYFFLSLWGRLINFLSLQFLCKSVSLSCSRWIFFVFIFLCNVLCVGVHRKTSKHFFYYIESTFCSYYSLHFLFFISKVYIISWSLTLLFMCFCFSISTSNLLTGGYNLHGFMIIYASCLLAVGFHILHAHIFDSVYVFTQIYVCMHICIYVHNFIWLSWTFLCC